MQEGRSSQSIYFFLSHARINCTVEQSLTGPNQTALVTYVTAGFPTPDETVNILLAMEAGGAGRYLATSIAEMRLLYV